MRTGAAPRVCSYPAYRYSCGDDAIDQASETGLRLDDWQCDVLRDALGERDDGKWAAFEVGVVVGRQQGKGALLEARAWGGLFCFGEELILWSAHEYRTAMEMFRRVKAGLRRMARRISDTLYDYDGVLIKVNNTNGDEGLERLDTGQRLQFIARSKNAGRGFSADCLIWDEAYALTEDQVDAQMPTLLARPNAQIWYTSSPPLDSMSGSQLFQVRKRGQAGESGLAYFEWGAEGCLDDLSKVDLDDRTVWAGALPAYGGRVTDEGVQRLRDAMSDAGFAREVLCIWPPEPDDALGWKVISEEDWADGLDSDSQLADPVALAVSVSWDRSRASICAAGARADGLLHGETIDNRAGTGWVVKRLVELARDWSPCAVVVNPGAPAGSLIPDIEAEGIEVKKVTSRETAQAYGALYDAVCGKPYLEDGEPVNPRRFRHIGDEELTNAVMVAQTRPLGDGHAWDLKDADGDVTPLDGVTLALHGYLTRPVEEQVNPPATVKSAPPSGTEDIYRPSGRLNI